MFDLCVLQAGWYWVAHDMTIDIETLAPLQRTAYSYWLTLVQNTTSPLRENFDPFAIATVLSNIILTRVIERGQDFQFRIFGQAVLNRLNQNYAGMHLSELPNQNERKKVWLSYKHVAETGEPYKSWLEYTGPYENISRADELYLPFFQSDGTVHSILVVVHFSPPGNPPLNSN